MVGHHASFDAVRELPEAVLRDLLASPEPTERVWAAWALALRIGSGSAPVLKKAAKLDPDQGMRRQLVVVLAAFGERDVVVALASDDPDPQVRATGCQYLVRLAVAQAALWPLVLARMRDGESIVRETLVLHLPAEAPPEVRALAVEAAGDPSLSVRQAVVEQLGNLLGPEARVPKTLQAAALREPDDDLRRLMLAAWIAREGGGSLLHAVAAVRRDDLAVEAIGIVAEKEPRIPWGAVGGLADVQTSKVQEHLFDLFAERLDEVPLSWLLQYLAGQGLGRAAVCSDDLLPRLRAEIALEPGDRAALAILAQAADKELAAGEQDWDDWNMEWSEWQAKMAALAAEGRRLCGQAAEEPKEGRAP
jgi:hypothetical protein